MARNQMAKRKGKAFSAAKRGRKPTTPGKSMVDLMARIVPAYSYEAQCQIREIDLIYPDETVTLRIYGAPVVMLPYYFDDEATPEESPVKISNRLIFDLIIDQLEYKIQGTDSDFCPFREFVELKELHEANYADDARLHLVVRMVVESDIILKAIYPFRVAGDCFEDTIGARCAPIFLFLGAVSCSVCILLNLSFSPSSSDSSSLLIPDYSSRHPRPQIRDPRTSSIGQSNPDDRFPPLREGRGQAIMMKGCDRMKVLQEGG